MSELPSKILKKLEELPTVTFSEVDELHNVVMGEDFTEIFNYYSENFPNESLKTQSEAYQRMSLYLYLTNQDASFVDQVEQIMYRKPVPNIDDFLMLPKYMGLQNGTLYPYWREKLNFIFAEDSKINRVLWTGSTGSGKTVTARKAVIYSLYRLLCLRNARAVLNVEPGSTLAVFILSVTQKNAYQTNFEPFINILSNMPCFQKVRNLKSFENFDLDNPDHPFPFYLDKANLTLIFPDNIILTLASSIANTVGYDIVISACFAPETKISIADTSHSIKELADNQELWKGKYARTLTTSLTEERGEIIACAPTSIVTEVIRVYITEEDYIECTLDHKWPIKNPQPNDPLLFYHHGLPCKYAKDLTEKDELIDG